MDTQTIECEACGSGFIPTSHSQKYCPDCGSHGKRIKEKYNREIARSIRYEQLYTPTIYTNICRVCGKTFQTTYKNKTICSDLCAKNHAKQKLKCLNCDTLFTEKFALNEIPDEEIRKRKHFCSPECKKEFEIKTIPEKICKNCKQPFRNKNKQFCSQDCQKEYKHKHKKPRKMIKPQTKTKKQVPCVICQKLSESPNHTPNPNTHTYEYICSDECLTIYKEQYRKKAETEYHKRLKTYIEKNGMCSICTVPYGDCERMQSDFRIIPNGAHYIDNKIQICPKFKTNFK